MCGRFTRFHTWGDIHEMYRLTDATETGRNTEARYNIAPTEDVLFITAGDDGAHKLREGRWWLVPWWAKELPKQPMFNARIETADTSGAFKDAWKSKRCLVPADGFYEWTKTPTTVARTPGSSSAWTRRPSASPAYGRTTRIWASRVARLSPRRLRPREPDPRSQACDSHARPTTHGSTQQGDAPQVRSSRCSVAISTAICSSIASTAR